MVGGPSSASSCASAVRRMPISAEAKTPRAGAIGARACAYRPVPAPTASSWQNRLAARRRGASACPAAMRSARSTSMRTRVVPSPISAQPSVMPSRGTTRPGTTPARRDRPSGRRAQRFPRHVRHCGSSSVSFVDVESVRQQGEVAQAQAALAPILPVKDEIEIDARLVVRKAQGFLDRPFGRLDAAAYHERRRSSSVHLRVSAHSRSVTLCSPGASNTQSPVYQSACSAMSSKWPCGRPPSVGARVIGEAKRFDAPGRGGGRVALQ